MIVVSGQSFVRSGNGSSLRGSLYLYSRYFWLISLNEFSVDRWDIDYDLARFSQI